eukprot:305422_1
MVTVLSFYLLLCVSNTTPFSLDMAEEQKKVNVDNNISDEKECKVDENSNVIVVAGATGAVGRHCVNVLVRDPRVTSVIALTRSKEKPADFYGLEEKTDDLSKLKHLIINYEEDIDKQLGDYKFTAGLSCIGVYTATVKNEADFFKREHEPNIKVAKAAALQGAKRWAYLSGMGVKQTDSKAWNQALFSFVKGSVEKDLQTINGIEFVNSCRPGFIAGRPGKYGGFQGFVEKIGNSFPSFLNTSYAVHRDDIATAMVYTILSDMNGPFLCYENEDIKQAANAYREFLKKK